MTTCTFLRRYFDRESCSVIKNQETKQNVDQNDPRSGSQQERPCSSSTKQQALSADSATFSNVHVYFFLLLFLPKALLYYLTVYKHVCMVGNASISANRRICGFTHIQVDLDKRTLQVEVNLSVGRHRKIRRTNWRQVTRRTRYSGNTATFVFCLLAFLEFLDLKTLKLTKEE